MREQFSRTDRVGAGPPPYLVSVVRGRGRDRRRPAVVIDHGRRTVVFDASVPAPIFVRGWVIAWPYMGADVAGAVLDAKREGGRHV